MDPVYILLIVLWALVAPDPVTLAATRGTAGAAFGAVGDWAGTTTTPRGARRGPARAAVRGAVAGVMGARARRAARADLWSRATGTGQRAATTGKRAVAATKRAVAAARHGAAAWRTRRAAARTNKTTDKITATDAVIKGEIIDDKNKTTTGTKGVTNFVMAAPRFWSRSTTTQNTTTNGDTAMPITELQNLNMVEIEARQAATMVGAVADALDEFHSWAGDLADRWAETPWGTEELDQSIETISEIAAALPDCEDIVEAVHAMGEAAKNARTVAEVAAEMGATGDIDRFA